MSEQATLNPAVQPEAQPVVEPVPDDGISFDERAQKKSFKQIMKQPRMIAGLLLGLGVIGFVLYLEHGVSQVTLPPPEVSYELLRNEGLTEGVPIAIKVNQVAVFMINDPMEGGAANRGRSVVETLEGAIEELEEHPGRVITIKTPEDELPAIVIETARGTETRPLIQLTKEDVTLAGHDDEKWVVRNWAERLTDSLKLMMFAEPPEFSVGLEFGDALTTLFVEAHNERGLISRDSLDDSYEGLSDMSKVALASFPPPGKDALDEPVPTVVIQ